MLRSALCEEILTATDTMLRTSRPMPSDGVEDLSAGVSDWKIITSSQWGCVLHGNLMSEAEVPPSTRPEGINEHQVFSTDHGGSSNTALRGAHLGDTCKCCWCGSRYSVDLYSLRTESRWTKQHFSPPSRTHHVCFLAQLYLPSARTN